MKKLILWICMMGLCSCQRNVRLEQALELAGSNRPELEKVLTHYQDSGLKYDAALFLIENMSGCYGADSTALASLHPVYDAYDEINRTSHFQSDGKWGAPGVWGERIDSLANRYTHLFGRLPSVMDLQHVKSDYLIREIDRSFLAWERNVYASGGSFEDFCEYVLPYRQQNGLVMDAVRDTFYQRHSRDYYVQEGKSWLEETDSLLYEYHHLTHSGFLAMCLPLALHEWLTGKGIGKHLALAALVLILVVLPSGMSRSAWVAALVASGYVLFMHFRERIFQYRKLFLAAGLLLVVLGIGAYH